MSASKIFNIVGTGVTVEGMASALSGFLEGKKGLISEILNTPQGIIVQAKAKDNWKKFVGMDSSLQIQFYNQGESVVVNVGSGKWIDKAGAATVGALVFAPLMITAAIGAWNTKKMPEEIFDFLEKYVLSGGKTAAITMSTSSAITDSEVICLKCKSKNKAGIKFCGVCGEKMTLECLACGAQVSPGALFCNSCGANIEAQMQKSREASVVTCAKCGAVIPNNAKFCPECSERVPQKLEAGMIECPSCYKALPGSSKFCPDCGTAIPQKIIPACPSCGKQVENGVKFCPECGTSMVA
jgi:RNA polymerase subunit RPABC4/transcription elongation factor Spt4